MAVVAAPPTCREAIAATWPSDLQSGAITVLTHENRSENPESIGSINKDSSQDFGCFQINNYWHKDFFAESDWSDPTANAKFAYQIYLGKVKQGKIGWSAWYAVEGILW